MRNLTNFLKRFITLLIYSLDIFICVYLFTCIYLSISQENFSSVFWILTAGATNNLGSCTALITNCLCIVKIFSASFSGHLGCDTKLFTLEIRNFVCGVMGNCCCKCKLLEISRYQHAYHRTFLNVSSSHGVIM